MVVANSPTSSLEEFCDLLKRMTDFLNDDANKRPEEYRSKAGSGIEDLVLAAAIECSKGTSFEESSFKKTPSQHFPDIVPKELKECNGFGIEVKSTKKNHWTSTGSSIIESTRVDHIERVFMTFGKLGGDPIEFITKPYEECLDGIKVTHMPRYSINMKLNTGETIFDKIGKPYDELRTDKKSTSLVARYYRDKEGKTLWWAGDDPEEESVSASIVMWNTLKKSEQKKYLAYAFVNFPELFRGKYQNFAMWLVSRGIVYPSIRDLFSAGGKEPITLPSGTHSFPAVFRRLKTNKKQIVERLSCTDTLDFDSDISADENVFKTNLNAWIERVVKESREPAKKTREALHIIFD